MLSGHRSVPAPNWHVVVTGPRAGDQRREALDFLAVSLGYRPGTFTVVHRCPHCGAADHGVPALEYSGLARRRHGPGALPPAGSAQARDPLPALSFSRARGWLATAWLDAASTARGWRIGVDLEDGESGAFQTADGLGDVGFSTGESAALDLLPEAERPPARARLWTLKEAVVKARGTGFDVDPASVAVTVPGGLGLGIPGHPEAIVVPGEDWPGGPVVEGLHGMVAVLLGGEPDRTVA
jgi:hypothetical protein